jgi:hypothetical protein
MAQFNASDALKKNIKLLSKVSDSELDALYRNCLFTIYPSKYEGWGLPVTESLCYGKIPVVSKVSSLPEAGGEFAEYFDVRSESEFRRAAERLIDDVPYRESRESKIKREFRPRSWQEVASGIVDHIEKNPRSLPALVAGSASASAIDLGRYYSVARNSEVRIWPGMRSGEIFRTGSGWSNPDHLRCWMRSGTAGLIMRLPEGVTDNLLFYLHADGPSSGDKASEVTVDIVHADAGWSGEIDPGATRVIRIQLPARHLRHSSVEVRVSAHESSDLAASSRQGGRPTANCFGLRGLYVCAENDLLARAAFFECLQIGDMRSLTASRGLPDRDDTAIRTDQVSVRTARSKKIFE